MRIGADTDGRLTALAHRTKTTSSTFDDFFEPASGISHTLYASPAISTSHEAVRVDTGTPLCMRAPGEATGSIALESAIDEMAQACAMDPLAFRLKNYAEVEPISGKPFSSKALRDCYARGAERFGWERRPLAPRLMRDRDGLPVGWGVGTATFPALMFQAQARAVLRRDGGGVMEIGAHDMGQGASTALAQIAADGLGRDIDHVPGSDKLLRSLDSSPCFPAYGSPRQRAVQPDSGRKNRMADKPTFPPTRRIGILVFDGFEPIDVFGFVEAFAIARFLGTDYGSSPPYPFETVLIARHIAKVKSANGPSVAPDWDFAQALQQPLDLLMVPGGSGTRPLLDETSDPTSVAMLLDWMRAMDRKVRIMASVCTGAAVLAKCGFLDGLPAATNHAAFGWVAQHGPFVLWDSVARWVDAGKYVTSAGVSAGTDLGFHLVSRLAGRAVAETAVIAAEYDWHRDPQAPIAYPQQAGFT